MEIIKKEYLKTWSNCEHCNSLTGFLYTVKLKDGKKKLICTSCMSTINLLKTGNKSVLNLSRMMTGKDFNLDGID